MRAGQLRQRITIERATETKSPLGDIEYTWPPFISRPAALLKVGGGEGSVGGKQSARQARTYELRYDSQTSAIADTDRVRIDGKVFGITAVFDPDGRRRAIHVDVLEQAIVPAVEA